MKRYEIRCTESQTRKALELGANIYNMPSNISINGKGWFDYKGRSYLLPTAEQMRCWLEEYVKEVRINQSVIGSWYFEIYINPHEMIRKNCGYLSRKEATLAAIDAALEYLISNKK